MESKNRNKWTNKFRELGKKKGSRHEFIKLYKEMKKEKDKNKKNTYIDTHTVEAKAPPIQKMMKIKNEN